MSFLHHALFHAWDVIIITILSVMYDLKMSMHGRSTNETQKFNKLFIMTRIKLTQTFSEKMFYLLNIFRLEFR